MTPRLAVTQEQAASMRVGVDGLGAARCVLRLPERPTMPCFDQARVSYDGPGSVPIPEGTRVEVGWWEDWWEDWWEAGGVHLRWNPVGFATLAEVHDESCLMPHSPDCCGYCPGEFVITLSDIKPVEADQ